MTYHNLLQTCVGTEQACLPHSFLHNVANEAYHTLLASLKLAQTNVQLNLLYSEKWEICYNTQCDCNMLEQDQD